MKRSFSTSFSSVGQDVAEARSCKALIVGSQGAFRELEQKVHRLELENTRLRAQIEKKDVEAEVAKRDFQIQLMKAEAENQRKMHEIQRKMHAIELLLAKTNVEENKKCEPEIADKKKPVVASGQKKQRFPWLNPPNFWNIPDDLLRKLTEYLQDDELFEARLVNTIFYGGFYEQHVVSEESRDFNFRRALKLAQMGRVFKNLEYFNLKRGENDSLTVANLNPLHFPGLNFLDVSWGDYENGDNYSESEDIPSNPNIRKVRITDSGAHWLTGERFPNIEELIWAKDEDCEFVPGRLPKLRLLRFHCLMVDFHEISKENFPSLERVVFYRETVMDMDDFDHEEIGNYNAAVERLQAAGVTITEQ